MVAPRTFTMLALLMACPRPAWAQAPEPLEPPVARPPTAVAPSPLPPLPTLRPHPRPRRDDALGTWDRKGRYTPVPRRQRFHRLHGVAGADIPRYPVVLVHGLFGFDTLRFGPFYGRYFVGVAEHLRAEGMTVFVPETTPFAALVTRAEQLKAQVEPWMQANGFEKVHLIAHSAGGLDSRAMISRLGMAEKVASLTTVSSPHHGVWYADFVLKWVMEKQHFWKVWDWLGIERQGIHDISVKGMRRFNAETPDAPGVRYFSFGGEQPFHKIVPPLSTMMVINKIAERAALGKRPNLRQRLALAAMLPKSARRALKHHPAETLRALVGEHDWIRPELAGRNDGLVSLSSARWGEYQADLAYDHLDEMGWLTTFKADRFYRNITRMLADAGL